MDAAIRNQAPMCLRIEFQKLLGALDTEGPYVLGGPQNSLLCG